MKKEDVKLALRYIVIGFVMYLSYTVVQPGYIKYLSGIGDIAIGAIYTSVFGALTFVMKSNFEQGIGK